MGYNSTIHMKENLSVKFANPDEETLSAEQAEAIQRVVELGLNISASQVNPLDRVQEIFDNLGPRDETISYWLYPRGFGNEIEIASVGEQGRAYDLLRDLDNLIEALEKGGFVLNGTFYVVGEGVGDLDKVTIVDNEYSVVSAALTFPDGEIYE